MFFSPLPVLLLFVGKTQESATLSEKVLILRIFILKFGVLPTRCSICHKPPGLKQEKRTEGKEYRCFRAEHLTQTDL